MTSCTAKKKDGTPCPARPLKGDVKCFFHSEKTAQANREAKARGGHEKARNIEPARTLPAETMDLTVDSPKTVVALIAATINQVRKGEVGTQVGSCIAQLCSVALKAIALDDTDRRVDELEAVTAPLRHLSPTQLLEIVDKGQANGVAVAANGH